MSWWTDIESSTGASVEKLVAQLIAPWNKTEQSPLIRPPGSKIAFPRMNAGDCFQPYTELACVAAAAGLPIESATSLASYFQFLERQASHHLKTIPLPLRDWLQEHYLVDLSAIHYAENICTIHGQVVATDRRIYIPGSMNLTHDEDIQLLIRALEHCELYYQTGGHAKHVLRFIQKVVQECPRRVPDILACGVYDDNLACDELGLTPALIARADTAARRPRPRASMPMKTAGAWVARPELKLQVGSALDEGGDKFEYAFATNGDLFAIDTGSNFAEVLLLSAGSFYQRIVLEATTPLCVAGGKWSFAVADSRDIFAVGNVESEEGQMCILSAASGYRHIDRRVSIPVLPFEGHWTFGLAPNRDLFAICKQRRGSNATEITILTSESDYQEVGLQTGTRIQTTDASWDFAVARNRDLIAIKKQRSTRLSHEIHILSAESRYQEYVLQTSLDLCVSATDAVFTVMHGDALAAVKKKDTLTQSTEVHMIEMPSGRYGEHRSTQRSFAQNMALAPATA